MSMNHSLRGFVAQCMGGPKDAFRPAMQVFPASPSTQTFTVVHPGWYEVAAWGPGNVSDGSATTSGSFAYRLVFLARGQTLSIAVGRGGMNRTGGSGSASGANTNTVVTFPDASTMTAAAAVSPSSPPSPSGTYDYGASGNAGTTNAVAAPSYTSQFGTVFTGGQPEAGTGKGGNPGGGGGTIGALATFCTDGMVIVTRAPR